MTATDMPRPTFPVLIAAPRPAITPQPAVSAGIRSPDMTSQRARPGEINRGARWVPPPPGRRPRFTSGKPSCASRWAIAEVAGEGDLEPAAEAVAVDRGHDRHRRLLDQVGHRLDARGTLAVGRPADEAGDVRAG